MREKIYVHSNISNPIFFKNILSSFYTAELTNDSLSDLNFKNNNVIFLADEKITQNISQSFFLNNNVLVFFNNKDKKLGEKKSNESNFFYTPIKIKQFTDTIKIYFFSKTIIYNDIKIVGEKIENINTGGSCTLTQLEKKILSEFFTQKKINRNYFLENIFKIKRDIRTKTIESHLTRIRKKLLSIKSGIQISLKDDIFYIQD
ncbi:helix-turn-helix domain-containing protein [Alphaproteobacteria bacterium]|nr:helix-turn-helix domain-containing protein [Alphaproteobacteria bacterium]